MSDARGLELAWEAHWYGPVAAVRPWLLERGTLLLLAFDIWALMLDRGSRYGLGFNVAHFRFLDGLLGVPSSGVYVGSLVVVGFLAFVAAVVGAPRWWFVPMAALYTFAWAISRLDSYQHHYLLSWVLVAFALLPRLSAPELRRDSNKRRRVTALGYSLLAATLAIVYAFTALAKADADWRSGAALDYFTRHGRPFDGLASLVEPWGVGREQLFRLLGTSAIGVEAAIAIGYALCPWRDRVRAGWARALFVVAWAAATALHLGTEMIGLRIGWFSYYVLFFAAVFFLPSRVLLRLADAMTALRGHLPSGRVRLSAGGIVAAASAAGALLVVVGVVVDLPGAREATAVLAVFGLGLTLVFARRGQSARLVPWLVASVAGAGLMWATVTAASRYEFHASLARNRQASRAQALAALEKAGRYARTRSEHAEVETMRTSVDRADTLAGRKALEREGDGD